MVLSIIDQRHKMFRLIVDVYDHAFHGQVSWFPRLTGDLQNSRHDEIVDFFACGDLQVAQSSHIDRRAGIIQVDVLDLARSA
jgi:hypothetical protein